MSVRIAVWVSSNKVCASLISMCALSENGCFVLLVMMGVFGVVVGVRLVSIVDEPVATR